MDVRDWTTKKAVKVTQSCLTLCDPMNYTVHGIPQGRILKWVAFPFSREYSQPRDQIQVSHIAGGFFTSWATREAQKESWVPKNWCFWNVVLEKTLKNPLDCKEIQPVNPKGDQSWVFIGRTDGEVETPILWLPAEKNWLTGKDLTHWKRPWCWERLKVGGEGDDRGWDSWMASLT